MALLQMKTLVDDGLVSEAEAGKLLGFAPGSLAVLRCRRSPNVPPHYKIGRRIAYRRSDLAAFVEARRVEPVSA